MPPEPRVSSMSGNAVVDEKHVIIIGAGISGLMAAHELVQSPSTTKVRITLVESSDSIGGRIKAYRDERGHAMDLGAEVVHGNGTLLTQFLQHYNETRWHHQDLFQELFITCYADGGPSPEPTKDGFYGMYYCQGELMMYNDERLVPVERALGTLDDFPNVTVNTSLREALMSSCLAPELESMVMAGYSNTLCCGDLNQISHSMLMAFEQYWQDHEEARDALLKTGMAGLIPEVYKDVENHVEVILKCHVERVEQMENGQVALTCSTGSVLMGDAVVVTCHPKYWKDLMSLPEEKGIATEFIGAECAMKVFLEFQGPRLFPDKLQTLVCADQPVPELWFRDLEDDLQLVVCFLTSSFAKDLLKASQNDTDQMTKIILNQLSTMFSISIQDLELALTVTHHQFWDVGYMFPKVGLQPHHLEQLAEPYGSVYFAGEATHTHACCTVQAAMETGVRAAKQIKQAFDRNE